jgi:folate-binding protein YgfZ
VTIVALRAARLPRGYVGVQGPDAADYLQRMLSNDVEALGPREACEALLLTPKARIIARVTVLRRGADDFLLLTEPGLAQRVRDELLRSRFAARCRIETEEHVSTLFLGGSMPDDGIPNADYGVPAWEQLDTEAPEAAAPVQAAELELLRIRARTPRSGSELDDRVLPAEAGLDERAVSFTKGCYPGQEPVARLHYRGHPNRGLRVLAVDGTEPLPADAELALEGKVVGRVTSAAVDPDGGLTALAYVRREVPADAVLAVQGRAARQLDTAGGEGAGRRAGAR